MGFIMSAYNTPKITILIFKNFSFGKTVSLFLKTLGHPHDTTKATVKPFLKTPILIYSYDFYCSTKGTIAKIYAKDCSTLPIKHL